MLRVHVKQNSSHRGVLSGYRCRLVTKPVWLQRPFGYRGRLVTEAVWIQRPSGYKGRLVTEVAWLQSPFSYGVAGDACVSLDTSTCGWLCLWEEMNTIVGSSSQADYLWRNSAMDDSIGGS